MSGLFNECQINQRHVYFLLFTFLITNQFFNICFIPIHALRIANWGFTLYLALYVLVCYISHRIHISLIYQWWSILAFLAIIVCSFFYLGLNTEQTVDETFRASIKWFQFILVFLLAVKEYNHQEIFRALTIFAFIWFAAWILGFISPIPLYDASGEFDAHRLFNEGRGIRRLNVAGSNLMHLWGLWCMSIYVATNVKKYLYAYFLCLLFVLLCVSRQHIVWYSAVGLLYLLYNSTNVKKMILIGGIFVTVVFILPQTSIYQKTAQLTKEQMKTNAGGKNDIRILATTYFFTEFPQNLYTVIMGHGESHSHSDYGKFERSIITKYGYVMADVGFAGLYVKYGVLGMLVIFIMFYQIFRDPCFTENVGLKLWCAYTIFSTIFSHNLDQSMIGIALCLYLLYIDKWFINNDYQNEYKLY